jgi:hypothetical protein
MEFEGHDILKGVFSTRVEALHIIDGSVVFLPAWPGGVESHGHLLNDVSDIGFEFKGNNKGHAWDSDCSRLKHGSGAYDFSYDVLVVGSFCSGAVAWYCGELLGYICRRTGVRGYPGSIPRSPAPERLWSQT